MGCEIDTASAAASSQGVWVFRWPLEHTAHSTYAVCVLSSMDPEQG